MNYKILNMANVVEIIQQMGCDLNVIRRGKKNKQTLKPTDQHVITDIKHLKF